MTVQVLADPTPQAKNERIRVLAVDDEPSILACLRRELRSENVEVMTAGSGPEGFDVLLQCETDGNLPAVVISDFRMPGMDGVQLLEKVKDRWPQIQRVLLTAFASPHVLEDAINRCEIHRFLNKPWDRAILRTTLLTACAQHRLMVENLRLTGQLAEQNRELRQWNEDLERTIDTRTQQLRLAKHEQTATLDAIEDPVILIDLDYNVKRANAALAVHAGAPITGMTGRKCYELFAGLSEACSGCPVPAVREQGEAAEGRVTLTARGLLFSVAAFPSGEPLGTRYADAEPWEDSVVCVHRDVTDEDRLQQKLYLSQKMAALGELAGAVAHEINNPLGGILAFAQIMKREVPEDDEKHEFLVCIEESANRCRNTVRNLLNYARFSPREERQLTQMGDVVRKATTIVTTMLKMEGVEVDYAALTEGADELPLYINSNEVQGVVLNLVTNAADAMPNGGSVMIRVRSDDSVVPPVVITTVSDDGEGIPPENMSKIFDPFFTTKEEGKGTGLGLSISYRVMQDNGGLIEVESVVGEGTTFTLTLPVDSGA
jgi:two-component system, NtrC family, sensor kinase